MVDFTSSDATYAIRYQNGSVSDPVYNYHIYHIYHQISSTDATTSLVISPYQKSTRNTSVTFCRWRGPVASWRPRPSLRWRRSPRRYRACARWWCNSVAGWGTQLGGWEGKSRAQGPNGKPMEKPWNNHWLFDSWMMWRWWSFQFIWWLVKHI